MGSLLGLLPWVTLAALAWGGQRRGWGWRLSLGWALLAWGLGVVAFSEVASAWSQLDLVTALQFWVLTLVAALAWAAARRATPSPAETADPDRIPRGTLLLGLLLVVAFLAVLGLRALIANYDTLLYHLPRVEQWVQNHSLRPFPTAYDLQDFYPPFGELAVLQSRLLAGNEHWATLVQSVALLGSAAAVAEMAQALGGGAWAALLAALALLALPMANLEASTSQTDLVGALWLAWAAAFTLRYRRDGAVADALAASAALGLALLSKGTNYVFGLPWGLWLAWAWLRRQGWRKAWAPAVMALLILAPNLGQWRRNFDVSGNWLASSNKHRVAELSLRGAASNLVKNLTLDAMGGDRAWDAALFNAAKGLHRALGWPQNDPALTWGHCRLDLYANLAGCWHEDYAGSPWHLLAGLLLAAALALGWRRRGPLPATMLALAAGYLGYAVLIRFNPWCNRLHLGVFALLCAPIGLGLEDALARPWRPLAGALLLGWGAMIATHHLSQPWDMVVPGRSQRYLPQLPYWMDGLAAGLRAGQLGHAVGLISDRSLEYPLWVGLQADGPFHLQQLSPSASTLPLLGQAPYRSFRPDVIIRYHDSKAPLQLDWDGRLWRWELVNPSWIVYQPLTPKRPRVSSPPKRNSPNPRASR